MTFKPEDLPAWMKSLVVCLNGEKEIKTGLLVSKLSNGNSPEGVLH
jgi:hypothetical protein